MRYLQVEWQRNEQDRIQWELERAEMKARIAKLEGEKRGLQLAVENHTKKIKILETSLYVLTYEISRGSTTLILDVLERENRRPVYTKKQKFNWKIR
jgi:hypothetical protein